MTHGFQQQDTRENFNVPKSVPTPQHGQKATATPAAPIHEARTFQPRPGR